MKRYTVITQRIIKQIEAESPEEAQRIADERYPSWVDIYYPKATPEAMREAMLVEDLQSNLLYHGIRGENASSIKQEILKNGFKFSGNKNSLTPDSISFFTEKRPAENFGDNVVVGMKIPKDLNLLDLRNPSNSFDDFKSGGYDGIITEANGGTEIQIHNPEKLKELRVDVSNPRAQLLSQFNEAKGEAMLEATT